MATFVQFYTVMLGFVNYYMYHSLNLMYPPKLSGYGSEESEVSDEGTFISERIAALNVPISKIGRDIDEVNELDQFPKVLNNKSVIYFYKLF